MKKITTYLIVFAFSFFLLAFSGCKKVWDYVKKHPDGVADNCRIDHIYFSFEHNDEDNGFRIYKDTINFTYNAAGNPLSMKYAHTKYNLGLDPFSSDKLFKYDNKNRLVVYLEDVSKFSVENDYSCLFWHKYTYINDHLVVDSTFGYGRGNYLVNDRPEGDGITADLVTKFTLDDWGRIIKAGETVYNYDAAGNLIRPGFTYTNKNNLKQTSKTWMFIARDYSINAPTGEATSYNSNNLPIVYPKNIPFFVELYIIPDNEKTKVTYMCK